MPRKYKGKKRNYRKRRPRVKPMLDAGMLIADKTLTCLKYHDDLVINVSGTGGSNYLYSCNSIYDPDYTGVGHQPLGRDQFADFYDRYVVLGSKITVTFKCRENDSSTNDDDAMVNCGISVIANHGETMTQNSTFQENNKTTYTQLVPQQPMGRVTKKFSAKQFFGANVVDYEKVGATVTDSPINQAFYQIRMWNPTSNTQNRYVYANVALSYIVQFRERKVISGS